MKLFMFTLAILSLSPSLVFAGSICGTIPLRLEQWDDPLKVCGGKLSYSDAIHCVNQLKDSLIEARGREARQREQSECICQELVRSNGRIGHYNRIRNTCVLE